MLKESRLEKKWALVIITLVCFGSYLASLSNGYALDDNLINAANPYVRQGIQGIDEIFSTPMSSYQGSGFEFRPIAASTFAVEHEFFGENPQLSHFINVVIYTLSCLLLYLTLTRLELWTETCWAFWTSLVFAIHPLHSEVINNLKNRDELLAFLFALVAFWYVIEFLKRDNWLWLTLAALSISVAIFSKVSAVPMVLIIPFVLWYGKKASVKKALVIFTTLFAFGWLRNLWMNLKLGSNLERNYAFYENPLFFSDSLSEFVSTAFASLYFYVKMSVFPYPLVSYYGFNEASVADWLGIQTILGVIFTVSILTLLIARRKQRDLLNLGLCLWLISILPYTNLLIPAPGVLAERFAFLSVLGFGILVSHGLSKLPSTKRNWKTIGVSIICLVAISYNNYRSTQWKDSLTLFEADVINAPESAKLQFLLAGQYIQEAKSSSGLKAEGYYAKAIQGYEKAVQIDTTFSNAYNVMGAVYYNHLNNPEKAIQYFQQALKLQPENSSVMYNLASAYRQAGELQMAASYFAKSIQQGRSDYLTHAQLSDLLMKLGQFKAVVAINQNAAFEGHQHKLLTFTGLAQLQLGDTLRGLANLEKVLVLKPENTLIQGEILKIRKSQNDKP